MVVTRSGERQRQTAETAILDNMPNGKIPLAGQNDGLASYMQRRRWYKARVQGNEEHIALTAEKTSLLGESSRQASALLEGEVFDLRAGTAARRAHVPLGVLQGALRSQDFVRSC